MIVPDVRTCGRPRHSPAVRHKTIRVSILRARRARQASRACSQPPVSSWIPCAPLSAGPRSQRDPAQPFFAPCRSLPRIHSVHSRNIERAQHRFRAATSRAAWVVARAVYGGRAHETNVHAPSFQCGEHLLTRLLRSRNYLQTPWTCMGQAAVASIVFATLYHPAPRCSIPRDTILLQFDCLWHSFA